MTRRSPFDADTHFSLPASGTPVDVDGRKLGEPLGLVACEACHRAADNVDDIRHAPDCPQRDVRSAWYRRAHGDPA